MTSLAPLPRTIQNRTQRADSQERLATLVKLLAAAKLAQQHQAHGPSQSGRPSVSVADLLELLKGLSGFDAQPARRGCFDGTQQPSLLQPSRSAAASPLAHEPMRTAQTTSRTTTPLGVASSTEQQTGSPARTSQLSTSPLVANSADQKTRGDVARFHREVAQWAKDGWVDEASAQRLTSRLGHIDTLLAQGPISHDTQKIVDQFAGDAFRLQFGKAGHVDTSKVTTTLGKQIDEIVAKGLATPSQASELRSKLNDLSVTQKPGGTEAWVKGAQDLRRAIVDTARSNAQATRGS